jgi:putative heme-binding domain-containing protein
VALPKISPNQMAQRQQAGSELVRSVGLPAFEPQLARLLLNPLTDLQTRGAVARALASLKPEDTLVALAPLAGDPGAPDPLRRKIAQALAQREGSDPPGILNEAFATLTRRMQVRLAESLAGSASGAERLLELVSQGRAPAALLLERSVKDKLQAAKITDSESRINQLTKGLKPPSAEIQQLIDARRAAFSPEKAQIAKGEKVFTQNCRPCHQIGGVGNVVGPQLDGIGGRGLDRLLEDVLDPNRNVDPAFHTTLVSLRDGDMVSGLFRREEGEAIVLANGAGKEMSIPKKDIVERRASETSLMPENFGEIIPQTDFNDLMAFLLSTGPKPTAKP